MIDKVSDAGKSVIGISNSVWSAVAQCTVKVAIGIWHGLFTFYIYMLVVLPWVIDLTNTTL